MQFVKFLSSSLVSFIRLKYQSKSSVAPKEMNEKCKRLLRESMSWCEAVAEHDPDQCCLFGDILELLPHGTVNGEERYSAKLKAVQDSQLRTVQECDQHGEACRIANQAQFCVSGLPCPDFSHAGKRQKRAGKTSPVYMATGKYHTTHRTPLLLVECTED